MQYDRISQDPTNFEAVFKRQISLADVLRQGAISPEVGNVEGKALFGAMKSLDTDIRARLFEHRIKVYEDRKALSSVSERSGGKQITDQRSNDDSKKKKAKS